MTGETALLRWDLRPRKPHRALKYALDTLGESSTWIPNFKTIPSPQISQNYDQLRRIDFHEATLISWAVLWVAVRDQNPHSTSEKPASYPNVSAPPVCHVSIRWIFGGLWLEGTPKTYSEADLIRCSSVLDWTFRAGFYSKLLKPFRYCVQHIWVQFSLSFRTKKLNFECDRYVVAVYQSLIFLIH